MRLTRFAAAIGLALAGFAASTASAQERTEYGPFYVLQSDPTTLYLDGPLAPSGANLFYQAVVAAPGLRTLIIDNDAMPMTDALVIADIVSYRRMDTAIPPDGACVGNCQLVFLAGTARNSDGALGGVLARDPEGDVYLTDEEITALLREALQRFGTDAALIDRLVEGTDGMLNEDELGRFAIERSHSGGLAEASPPQRAIEPDDYAFADFEQFGTPSAGQFIVIDASGTVTDQMPMEVIWGRYDGGPQLAIEALAAVDGVSMVLALHFWPISVEDLGYVSDRIMIEPWAAEPEWQPGFGLYYLAAVTEEAERPLYVLLETHDVSTEASQRTLVLNNALVPTTFSPVYRETLGRTESFFVIFPFAGGRVGAMVVELGTTGRALFDEALAAWE